MIEEFDLEKDWVRARSECSVVIAFEQLRHAVEHDVTARNALLPDRPPFAFKFKTEGDSFYVAIEGYDHREALKFSQEKGAIVVYRHGERMMEATLTFNADGECRFLWKGTEYRSWQFRKLALEDFFFNR
jgi:hypothetical protein